MKKERIERHTGAVGLAYHRCFIVPVDFMFLQLPQVFFSQIRAVQFLELAIHGQAVDGDCVALIKLGFLCGYVFAFHIGVGVNLTSRSSVGRICVAIDKVLMPLMSLVLIDSHLILSFLSACGKVVIL